jgi:hypothetical protein
MISVVLNVYKRPYTLERQIDAILNQSIAIKPENIHVWYNNGNVKQHRPKNTNIKTYVCNWNTKFFGRFTVPLLITTPFVALFDDDIYPQRNWLKNCHDSMMKKQGIYGGSGVVLKSNRYQPNYKIGWNGIHSNNIERVDLVGHAWFFKQEWTKYLFYEKPITYDNGEDIMFSYLTQKYGNINTFVPPHPENNKTLWSTDYSFALKHGNDSSATSLKSPHYGIRNQVCEHAVKNGWKLVKNTKVKR